ncbi:hypothetical protein J8L86_12075 [Shewanella sp. MMG014]|uniref:hypothetical protein n=1 Tax=Shewanella sp. MMG014 TaxID=2822691 RepID=UPI001B38138E|nr:hypothetical protein [Shewanella sp. MMG014]MBQ4890588.1 hypothetical protein [Shewanella sp. MMG014]
MSLERYRSCVLKNKKECTYWLVFIVAYLILGVLLRNPELTCSLIAVKVGVLKYMENSSNVIAIVGAVAAISSSIAAFYTSRVASSSRDLAKNALSFQYQDSIKESLELITSTLISTRSVMVKPTDTVETSHTHYSLSLKRTDWIFAAQEVDNVISQIKVLAINPEHEKRLMERYGRMLEQKISPSKYGKTGTIFTCGKPNDSYLVRKFVNNPKNIRDEDLFVVYLFTEQYKQYNAGSGQYPVNNICCYFGELSSLNLS